MSAFGPDPYRTRRANWLVLLFTVLVFAAIIVAFAVFTAAFRSDTDGLTRPQANEIGRAHV